MLGRDHLLVQGADNQKPIRLRKIKNYVPSMLKPV